MSDAMPDASLTDEQCAEIAAWSRRIAATGPAPRIIVSRWRRPGDPERTSCALYAHPEDYIALKRWADRQERFDITALPSEDQP